MKNIIECPYCEGHATLNILGKEMEFRKETYFVNEFFSKCDKCAEEFTTTETDTLTISQLY